MELIEKQNDIIISLLAKQIIGPEKIRKTVISNKRNPAEWIKGYNACDGKKGVGEIAKIANVAQPTATVMLKSWEEEGIIYNIGSETKPLYKKLIKISNGK